MSNEKFRAIFKQTEELLDAMEAFDPNLKELFAARRAENRARYEAIEEKIAALEVAELKDLFRRHHESF